MLYWLGCNNSHIPFVMYKNSVENSSIAVWLSLEAKLTSSRWKPCYASAMTVLSCHIPAPKVSEKTLNGGFAPSANQTSHNQYPDPYQSMMLGHSLMWAWLQLESSSANTGEHGTSYPNGHSMAKNISAGLKPLASNYLKNHSSVLPHNQHISSSMVIKRALLRDCGMGKAETPKSTMSLNVFTCSLKNIKTVIPSTWYMSKANLPLQMDHPRESTL